MTSTPAYKIVFSTSLQLCLSSTMSPSVHGDSTTRRRTTRACDQCRKTKSRCEHPPQSQEPCRNCLLSGATCTFLEPSHKRGPPKGYLSALEQRLHDAEALLGVIISSSDSRASTMVADLSKDSLAASIIARVANSSFGPVGRNALRHRDCNSNSRRRSIDLRQQQMNEHEAPLIDSSGHLVFTSPSNTWQDYLNLRLSLESGFRAQAVSKPLSQNLAAEQLLQSCHISAPKPLTPQTSFRFPVPSAADAAQSARLHAGTCAVDSPSSMSSDQMVMCHDTPEGDDSDDTASLSTNQSPAMLVGDYNGHVDRQKDVERASYNRLAHALGTDTIFTLDSPFDANQMTGIPIGVSRPSMAKSQWTKPEETDTDSWTSLVVEGSDQPPPFDMPDLVCPPVVLQGQDRSKQRFHRLPRMKTTSMQKSPKNWR